MFKHRYLPITEQDRKDMLEKIGVESVAELFEDIPVSSQSESGQGSRIPEAMSELELTRHMKDLAGKNATDSTHAMFLGAGVYDHFIPSVVNHVLLRQEFFTA